MKLNNTLRMAISPLVVSILTSTSLAQVPPAGGYQVSPPPNVLDEFGFLSTERIVYGDIAGSYLAGALVHTNSRAVAIYSPSIHKAAFVVEVGVSDLDLIEPAAPGGPAGMVLSLSDGIWIYEWDVTSSDPRPYIETQITTNTLTNLDILRGGDVDGAGREDLIAVQGSTVSLLLNAGTGWSDPPAMTFTAGGTVLDVVAIDWDSDAQSFAHIAVQLDDAIEVWARSLTQPSTYALEETFTALGSGGHMALVPATTSEPAERLAWSQVVPPITEDVLWILSEGGVSEYCGRWPTPGETPNSLVAGVLTVDGDSRPDLLTTSSNDQFARLFHHRTVNPPYVAGVAQVSWGVGTTNFGGSTPAFGDVTLDGIPDLLVEKDDALHFLPGQPPYLEKLVAGEDAWLEAETSWGTAVPAEAYFSTTVEIPNGTSRSHVQVILWKSNANPSASHFRLVPQAVSNLTYVIDSHDPLQIWMKLDAADPCDFNEAYFMSLRLVDVVNNAISNPSETIHAGITVTQSTADLINYGASPVTIVGLCDPNNTSLTFFQRPGLLPLPGLIEFENDAPPQIMSFEPGTTGSTAP